MSKGNQQHRTMFLELTPSELMAVKFAVKSDYEVVSMNSGLESSWKEDRITLARVLAKIEHIESDHA